MSEQKVIEIRNLCFAYNGKEVLHDINLTVKEKEYLAIIGPNGGGKTTLLKLILGLLKPNHGTVKVFGEPPERHMHHIGYVPQQISIKKGFPISVVNTVLMGLTVKNKFGFWYSETDKQKAYDALKTVEMEQFANKKISDLSGGQKQRVFLARALVSNPKLLILDEPTSSIDPHGTFCFFTFLERLSEKMTIVVVSHDLSLVASKIYSLACVNKRLIYNEKPVLTDEMTTLLYGSHDTHSCAVGAYLAEKTQNTYHAERK
jgi:zinc transport system ATP-binding protein